MLTRSEGLLIPACPLSALWPAFLLLSLAALLFPLLLLPLLLLTPTAGRLQRAAVPAGAGAAARTRRGSPLQDAERGPPHA